MTLLAKDCLPIAGTHEAESHRLNGFTASLAVFVVPGAFPQRESTLVEIAPLIWNQNPMTVLDGIPSRQTKRRH